jgi:hypothetical protein
MGRWYVLSALVNVVMTYDEGGTGMQVPPRAHPKPSTGRIGLANGQVKSL